MVKRSEMKEIVLRIERLERKAQRNHDGIGALLKYLKLDYQEGPVIVKRTAIVPLKKG